MNLRFMGIETEYAFTALGPAGKRVPAGPLLEGPFMDLARKRHPAVQDGSHSGAFFGNASCLYIDQGHHPELCTPECTDPWEVVRYVKAGDRMLRGICAALVETTPEVEEIFLSKSNVDYSGTGATWGTHESYMHRVDPSELSAQVVPHLVSRIVFSGDGGFDPASPGLEFLLSPRSSFLVRVRSGHSTTERGIFHTKNEPLGGKGFHRLHLICGNSLHSQLGLWLTIATTALVVRLAEAGKNPGAAVQMRSPLRVLRAFAADPSCTTRVLLTSGERVLATDIQRHYLDLAERHLGADFMPVWAEEACNRWREVLAAIDADPDEMDRTLDWSIKHAVFSHYLERNGTDWQTMHLWTRHIKPLYNQLLATQPRVRRMSVASLLGPSSPVRGQADAMKPLLRRSGLNWDDLGNFLRLRSELFALDTRFAELSDSGIFQAMDDSHALDDSIVDSEEIDVAVNQPPPHGRPRLRGRIIQAIEGDRKRIHSTWEGLWDHNKGVFLDLDNPFETEERWKDIENPMPPGRLSTLLRIHRRRLRFLREEGDLLSED